MRPALIAFLALVLCAPAAMAQTPATPAPAASAAAPAPPVQQAMVLLTAADAQLIRVAVYGAAERCAPGSETFCQVGLLGAVVIKKVEDAIAAAAQAPKK